MMVFLKLIMLCTTCPGVLLTMKPMTMPAFVHTHKYVHCGSVFGTRRLSKWGLTEEEGDQGLVYRLYPSCLEIVGYPKREDEQQQDEQQRSRRP